MAATIATATTLPRTTPSAGPSSTCPTTSPTDASTRQAPKASRPPSWPSAWREYAHLGGPPLARRSRRLRVRRPVRPDTVWNAHPIVSTGVPRLPTAQNPPPAERKPHFPTERVPRLAQRTLRGRRVAKRTLQGWTVSHLSIGSSPSLASVSNH